MEIPECHYAFVADDKQAWTWSRSEGSEKPTQEDKIYEIHMLLNALIDILKTASNLGLK